MPTPPSDRARHVVAIDGDFAMRRVYAELLVEGGYRVTLLPEPPDDPEDVLAVEPSLVIVDLHANRGEAGSSFIARLRDHAGAARLPVVVCSADIARLRALDGWLRTWECGVILKPFDIDDFLTLVEASMTGVPAVTAVA